MKLIESHPLDPYVQLFIDRYQYYDFNETTFIKAVPNGKIESWIINEGECQLWNETDQCFEDGFNDSFYPAGNRISFFKINKKLRCLNIKWKLTALSLSFLKNFLTDWQSLSVKEFLGAECEKLRSMEFLNNQSMDTSLLDSLLSNVIRRNEEEHHILKIIQCIEHEFPNGFKVDELSDKMHTSSKTIERNIKNYFSLSPGELSRIIRFSNTTQHLKGNGSLRLSEALSFGFYDQSHFIRECRKITGYSPTEFFSRLRLPTNDIIFES
ncbi:MAG: AraC family transcriptional regulator [Cyclobacteriaceae bacterium]